MKKSLLLIALILCLSLAACKPEKEERVPPSRSTDPILDIGGNGAQIQEQHTPVYVTVFEDTAYLSIYPRMTDGEEEEPECDARDIANGGTILCGGAHEAEMPITRVIILDQIHPDSTADWFRNMTALRTIEGLGNLHLENVTDMSNMFNGCVRLTELDADGWDVSNVTDMTGIFDGCDALADRPSWYTE